MLKRFMDGLMFGSGFAIAFVMVWLIVMHYMMPVVLDDQFGSIESTQDAETIDVPPPIKKSKDRYLGSTAMTRGEFTRNGALLSRGDGEIIGTVQANGKPARGLKLRLALNGSVHSQWATTDEKGQYVISVPYGEYAIQGFELDRKTVDKPLAGMISHPQQSFSTGEFNVSPFSSGSGINIRFVSPIIKQFKNKVFKRGEEIVLDWEEYPNAEIYTVQIYESADPNVWGNKNIFDWGSRPELLDAQINLSEYAIKLKPDMYYLVTISAADHNGAALSETPFSHRDYDFQVIE